MPSRDADLPTSRPKAPKRQLVDPPPVIGKNRTRRPGHRHHNRPAWLPWVIGSVAFMPLLLVIAFFRDGNADETKGKPAPQSSVERGDSKTAAAKPAAKSKSPELWDALKIEGKFERGVLKPGEKIALNKDEKAKWAEVPSELSGGTFTRFDHYAGRTKFKVIRPTTVWMALLASPWGGGGSGGEWEKEVLSPEQLAERGWEKLNLTLTSDGRSTKRVIYRRVCRAGEEFTIRNHKYVPPILIEPPAATSKPQVAASRSPGKPATPMKPEPAGSLKQLAQKKSAGARKPAVVYGGTPTVLRTPETPQHVAFSPDSRSVAVCGLFEARLWTISNGRSREGNLHNGMIMQLEFSPDSRQFASVALDKRVRFFETGSGNRVGQYEYKHHLRAVAWSPDGKLVAAAAIDGNILLIDTKTHQLSQRIYVRNGTPRDLAFSPDGKLLASAGWGKERIVRLWDVAEGQEIERFPKIAGTGRALAFSPDGQQIVVLDDEGKISIFDTDTGKERRVIEVAKDADNKAHTLDESFRNCDGLAISPDGRTIAVGSWSSLVLFDAETGKELRRLKGHTERITGVAFSPDGQWLASVGFDRALRLWKSLPAKRAR